jgi:hypothetical protein
VALIAGGSILAAVFGVKLATTITSPAVNPNCLPPDDVKGIKQNLKLPAYLPEGYEYKCGIAQEAEANLLYWNQPVDKSSYQFSTMNSVSTERGSILFRVADAPEITDSTKAVMDDYDNILKNNPALKPQLVDINGKKAWAHEAVSGSGKQTAEFPEGQVITNTFDMPARLRIYDSGQIVRFEGFVPLDELVRIARSLP